MEHLAKQTLDNSSGLCTLSDSSDELKERLKKFKNTRNMKFRSYSNYGLKQKKRKSKMIEHMLDSFQCEPVKEEQGDDSEDEEKHKIHKLKLFLDIREDRLFKDRRHSTFNKKRSKSTEMSLPKVLEERDEYKQGLDKTRKFSLSRFNGGLIDKMERGLGINYFRLNETRSLFNAASRATIEEEAVENGDESCNNSLSCFSAPNRMKPKIVDEIDSIKKQTPGYKEINEVIEEISESDDNDMSEEGRTKSLKEKRKSMKALNKMISNSDIACLYLINNKKYSFGTDNDPKLDYIQECCSDNEDDEW
jgi:hypothetical protein